VLRLDREKKVPMPETTKSNGIIGTNS